MIIILKTSILSAVSIFAASMDVRYYMCGVNISIKSNGETRYTATDGHTLATANYIDAANLYEVSLTIPINIVLSAVKSTKAEYIELSIEGDQYSIGNMIFLPVEGKFPDCSRFFEDIDTTPPKAHSYYKPEYMMRMEKARKILKLKDYAPYVQNTYNKLLFRVGTKPENSIRGIIAPYMGENYPAATWES